MPPLGFLALGLAVASVVAAGSYFFSPLAYLAGAIALPLGFMARGHEVSHATGTAAVVVAGVGIAFATFGLFALWE